ncbi:amidohydrolase family protein [Paenibacillus sp. Marseille-Q4541]|uniref:amidohydrolase family protein n=1 Tax=Paenibacillus sp. Marseille-Q4541 TaxID=2831522 RepID=UPI001BA52276|nr:amidohydrolase family protein [Paenibacillus sp. Marseille-Q4541]
MTGKIRLINAALQGNIHEGKPYEIVVENGRFTKVKEQPFVVQDGSFRPLEMFSHISELTCLEPEGELVIDLKRRMVLPGLVDIHMHLDKAFSLREVGNQTGTLLEAIQNYGRSAPFFTKETIRSRIIRTALQSVSYGSTRLRSHLDFPIAAGEDVVMRTVEAALEAKSMLKGVVDIQFFPMVPYRDLGKRGLELIEESIRMGMDGIGGAPHLSATPDQDIEGIFKLAARLGTKIDLHCDETDDPVKRTVLKVAEESLRYGFQGNVTAGHLCSLSSMPPEEAEEVLDMMSLAGVHAVTLPAANLYLQGRADLGPVRRGVTRVRELREAGVTVAAASDNINDPFHPFGRGDLLQIALLTGYASHYGSPDDMNALIEMVTTAPAEIYGCKAYGIHPSHPADFVIVDAERTEEIFTMLPAGRWVAKSGKWVSMTPSARQWGSPQMAAMWEQVTSEVFTEGRM